MVPFRPAGKRLTYVAAGAAALFVAAGAFAGAMVQPYLADQALVATKLKVAETSANAITTLWTYTPDNIDSLPQRASQYLSGDFAAQYRTFVDSIVPTNKQAQVSSNTQVMGTAVESIGPNEATAIVYTNSVSTSPVTKNIPSLRYLSYRVTLKRDGSNWRITQMPALTKLDLSPQL
jgi:Mce-associated membrane protein